MCYDGLNGYENCPAGFVDDFQDGLDNQDSHQDGGTQDLFKVRKLLDISPDFTVGGALHVVT